MRHRRHAVEEVRGVPRARLHRGHRRVVVGARVAERHAVPGRRQRAHRDRCRRAAPAPASRCRCPAGAPPSRPGCRRPRSRRRRAARGRGARPAAGAGTRPAAHREVGVDEVALEMRRQHARARRAARSARRLTCFRNAAQHVGRAGDARRAEGRDAERRQQGREPGDRRAVVQHVVPLRRRGRGRR